MGWWLALPLAAQNSGTDVVVVYNRLLPESKSVADHYVAARKVPPTQVFGFDLSSNAEISRAEFVKSLQAPLARSLEKAKLWRIGKPPPQDPGRATAAGIERGVVESKIRYCVLCYGVPYKIAPAADLKEPGVDSFRPELRRNEAAVDSELALLPLVKPAPLLAGPLRNPLAGVTNASLIDPTNGVLMVARLDGATADIAKGLVDKALQAEANGLWGRAYFDLRSVTDPNYKQGDDVLRAASQICRMLGYETTVDTNAAVFSAAVPMSDIAWYAGWYEENACGPFGQAEVDFMPGAFAYHLHSFSAAVLRTTSLHWVGPLIARGATITMGAVYEPYLSGTPDIAMFTERMLYSGFSFGEAAYACQGMLSWQTTVVGDPLYRPLARNLDVLREELERRDPKLAPWPYLRLVNLNLAQGKPLEAAVAFLEGLPLRKRSAVLSEKLAELYSAIGKPSSSVSMYEQALSLDPTAHQRLRLRLELADKLSAIDHPAEAAAQLKKLLEEFPNYPGRATLEERLLALNGLAK